MGITDSVEPRGVNKTASQINCNRTNNNFKSSKSTITHLPWIGSDTKNKKERSGCQHCCRFSLALLGLITSLLLLSNSFTDYSNESSDQSIGRQVYCEEYHHVDELFQRFCLPNECTCREGTPVSPCKVNGDNQCESCNAIIPSFDKGVDNIHAHK